MGWDLITTISLNTVTKTFNHSCSTSQISELCKNKDNFIWADVSDPTGEDFKQLAEEFNFHPLSIEDCQKGHQRPKIEEYKGYYFLVLYEAELVDNNQHLQLRELDIFLGSNYLVTVHKASVKAVYSVRSLWDNWKDRGNLGNGTLAYLLMDVIVDNYMPILDALSERVDDLEDEIFGEFKPESIEEIFRIKKQLLYLRRFISPFRDVLNVILRREQPIFSAETYLYMQDVYDHTIRIADTIDALRDMLSSTMDAYLSVSGNRMNMVMKRLTSIATILMSVTLIAGIYGMNFDFMPELKWRYGYVFALSSMVALALVLYFYLRKIDWL